MVALATRTGARSESRTPRCRQASSSASVISSPSRYLARTSSSASEAASRSWSRRVATSASISAGIADLDLLLAVPAVGLAMDEVDVAAEGVGLAEGELERRDLVPEGVAEGVEDSGRIRVLAVALVDDEEGGGPVRARQRDGVLRAGLHAARGVDADHRGVRRLVRRDDLGREVRVAGRVDDRDEVALVVERGDARARATCAASAPRARSPGVVVPSSTRPCREMVPVRNRSASASVVLPAPAWPARTTLRRWGVSTLFVVIGAMEPRGAGGVPAAGRRRAGPGGA